MKTLNFLALFSLLVFVSPKAEAKYQKNITGRDPQQVQQNAFEEGMDYPVGPLRCNQRCSQWWERE